MEGFKTFTAASDLLAASREEYGWLQHVCSKLNNEQLGENDNLSWASRQVPELRKVCNITLLPLFKEHANTPAMICHSMKVLKRTTEYLNPGPTPVLTVDQPLYALAKKIQWEIGGDLAEDRFVVMVAPFHTEDKSLKVVGQWLEESGWLSTPVQPGVATSGRAEGIKKGSHNTCTQYAHQVREHLCELCFLCTESVMLLFIF